MKSVSDDEAEVVDARDVLASLRFACLSHFFLAFGFCLEEAAEFGESLVHRSACALWCLGVTAKHHGRLCEGIPELGSDLGLGELPCSVELPHFAKVFLELWCVL